MLTLRLRSHRSPHWYYWALCSLRHAAIASPAYTASYGPHITLSP
ncbi:hypothetical protein BIFDEN_00444 [Bifidobacterium dentium ATCC 27678]|nr:hypothetical protein BIFDEN_00444 [Bifidobacterium dentium ATCC 27678]